MIIHNLPKEKIDILEDIWFISLDDVEDALNDVLDDFDYIDVELEFGLEYSKNSKKYLLSKSSIELMEAFSSAGFKPIILIKFEIGNIKEIKQIRKYSIESLEKLNGYQIFSVNYFADNIKFELELTDKIIKYHKFGLSYFNKYLKKLKDYESTVYKSFLSGSIYYDFYQVDKENILSYTLYYSKNAQIDMDQIDDFYESKKIILEIVEELENNFNNITYDFNLTPRRNTNLYGSSIKSYDISFSITFTE